MEKAYLLLGTNLGNRIENLHLARNLIDSIIGKIIRCSSIYETAPWGKENQPSFLNQAVNVETTCSPSILLDKINGIELSIGKNKKEHWGSRKIDIDILYFGEEIVKTPSLEIPHPYFVQRKFALVPIVEISPHLIHPILQISQTSLLQYCQDTLEVSPTIPPEKS